MSSWTITKAVGLLAVEQFGASTFAQTSPETLLPGKQVESVVHLPEALPVEIEIAEPLGSNVSHIDDMFAIRIAAPVVFDGMTVIPAGATGQGQVVHAAKSTGLGKAGELILAARFVDCGGIRIPLRGMRFATSGTDKSVQAVVLSSIAIPFAFLSGGKVLIPAGTHAMAKLSAAVDLHASGCPPVAAATTSQEGKIR